MALGLDGIAKSSRAGATGPVRGPADLDVPAVLRTVPQPMATTSDSRRERITGNIAHVRKPRWVVYARGLWIRRLEVPPHSDETAASEAASCRLTGLAK